MFYSSLLSWNSVRNLHNSTCQCILWSTYIKITFTSFIGSPSRNLDSEFCPPRLHSGQHWMCHGNKNHFSSLNIWARLFESCNMQTRVSSQPHSFLISLDHNQLEVTECNAFICFAAELRAKNS